MKDSEIADLGIAQLVGARFEAAGRNAARLEVAGLVIHLKESARGFALQRCVSKEVLAIGPQHKVDEPVAEAAHAIEKQDRLPVFRFTVGRVVHRHASFTGPIPLPHRAGYRAQVLFSRTDWVS